MGLPTWDSPPPLQPRRVSSICGGWVDGGKYARKGCQQYAEVWTCCDDMFVEQSCPHCAKALDELQALSDDLPIVYGKRWYLEPIYHNRTESITLPRDMGERDR